MKKRDIYIRYLALAFSLPVAEAGLRFEAVCEATPGIREQCDGELSEEEGLRLLEALVDGTADLP